MEEGVVALCQTKSRSPLQWPTVDENGHSGGQKHEEDFYREESSVMEHISRNHMQPSQVSGKSYFICSDKNYVFEKFVPETMNRPDKSFPYKSYKKRGVRQKTFPEQVGVHGLRNVPCYTVTVLFEIHRVYIWPLWSFVFCLSFVNNTSNNVTTPSTNQRSWPDSGQILRHQYGISAAESQTFLLAKRPLCAKSEYKRLFSQANHHIVENCQ